MLSGQLRIESVSLMLLGRAFHWEGATYLKARWQIALFYNPLAQELEEMIRSLIEENEMECMAK